MATLHLRQGENAPEVTSPTTVPSGVWISLCCRAGGPVDRKPTRRRDTPSAIWARMTAPPRKSKASRRRLPTVQVSPASTGVMSSFRSLPYRHSPASRRSASRAPRPHSRTVVSPSSVSASATARSPGTEISNPSSPV